MALRQQNVSKIYGSVNIVSVKSGIIKFSLKLKCPHNIDRSNLNWTIPDMRKPH